MKLKPICILLIFIYPVIDSSVLKAQTFREIWNVAEKNLEENKFDSAYTLLKRLYFFSDSTTKKECEEKLAYAALYSGRYKTAAMHFESLSRNANKEDYAKFEVLRLSSLYNAGLWQDLIECTDSSSVQESDPILLNNILYLRFLSLIMLNQKEEAIQTGNIFRQKIRAGEIQKFDSLLLAYSKQRAPDPKKAARMSLLIPGLGQLYSHDKKNALNAFILNETLIGAYIFTSIRIAWPEATLFWFFFIPHYYIGNARSAKDIAQGKSEHLQKYYCSQFQAYGKTFWVTDK